MKRDAALAERERLEKEIATARRAHANSTRKLGELDATAKAANQRRMELYTQRAKGDDVEQAIEDAERQRREALGAMDGVREAQAGAERAQHQAQRELGNLLERELDTFAAEAEKATQAALAALAALGEVLAEPYAAAQEAWSDAQEAWRPLAEHVAERAQRLDRQAGLYPPADTYPPRTRVPSFPVPAPAAGVFEGRVAPRPPALAPESEPAGEPEDLAA